MNGLLRLPAKLPLTVGHHFATANRRSTLLGSLTLFVRQTSKIFPPGSAELANANAFLCYRQVAKPGRAVRWCLVRVAADARLMPIILV